MPVLRTLTCLVSGTLALVLGCESAAAQATGSQSAGLPTVYVGTFNPVESAPTGIGPLHALNAGMHRAKAQNKAAQLSSALVDALRQRQVAAQLLPPDEAQRPQLGWLVQGIYYALDQNSRLVSLPLPGNQNGSNVEVTITVADLARDPGTPFAVIGAEAVMKGQGAPVGWNPYVVAAKFVLHQVEGQDSISVLAGQLAQTLIDQQQALLSHAPPPAGH